MCYPATVGEASVEALTEHRIMWVSERTDVVYYTVVMAVAERLEAQAIATLDLRDFASVELAGHPALWPRDL